MTGFDNSVPIVNQPLLYVNGALISNNATTPNSKFDVSAGIMRDSTNTYDINLGNFLGMLPYGTANASTVCNCGVNGLNGLDTGSLGASKIYYVYVVGDAVSGNATGVIASLAAPSSGPLMPFGYNVFRHIGYMFTDGSSHFLLGYNSGNGSSRQFKYDAYRATSVTAGTSATYAAIDLSALVPPLDQTPVMFEINWTANAAADSFNMQGANSTGDAWTVIAPVAGGTAHTVAFGEVLAQLVSSAPKVNYKVSAVGGVAINVSGFKYYL